MEITDSTLGRRDWDAGLGPAAMQHGWSYGAVAARHGALVRRVHLRDGGTEGRAQVICRSLGPVGLAHLPLGILCADRARAEATTLAALRRFLSRERPHILIAPSPERPQRLAPRLAGPRSLAVLDLGGADLRAGLSKKWRNRLRAAEGHGLEIAASAHIPDWLVATERRQQRRRRYGNLTPGWIAAWQRLAPGAALTLAAGPSEAPIAAMSFVLHGQVATYLLGWTSEAGRHLSAHNLLMWQAMTVLRARGGVRLDLGQIDRGGNPGLARFKLGTGAGAIAVPPVYGIGPDLRDVRRGCPGAFHPAGTVR